MMTKKQTEEMERLAKEECFGVKDHHMKFMDGYRAAQQPEQLILNEHVKGLVEALKYYSNQEHFDGDWENPSGEPPNMLCLNSTDEFHWIESGVVAKKALKPFQNPGVSDEK